MTMFFYVSLNNNKTFFSHFIDTFCFNVNKNNNHVKSFYGQIHTFCDYIKYSHKTNNDKSIIIFFFFFNHSYEFY